MHGFDAEFPVYAEALCVSISFSYVSAVRGGGGRERTVLLHNKERKPRGPMMGFQASFQVPFVLAFF